MGKGLSNLWRGNQKTQQAALPTPKNENDLYLETQFRKRFQNALYGDYCRTQTYYQPGLGDESDRTWREACYIPETGWVVKTMRSVFADDGTRKVISAPTHMLGSFLDAIEILATFEQAQLPLNSTVEDEAEIERLGFMHYRAFGEREGLVFDDNGQPHPTAGGFIVSAGTFAADAQDRAIEAVQKKNKTIADIPAIALPKITPEEGAAGILKQAMTLQKIVGQMEGMRAAIAEAEMRGWIYNSFGYTVNNTEDFKRKIVYERQGFSALVGQAFTGMETQGVQLKASFERAYCMISLYGLVSICAEIKKGIGKYNHYTQEQFDNTMHQITSIATSLGYDSLTSAEIYRTLYKESAGRKAQEVVTWAKKVQEALENRNDAPQPQFKPALPAPGKGA